MVWLAVILERSLLDWALSWSPHVLQRELLWFLFYEIHFTHSSCFDWNLLLHCAENALLNCDCLALSFKTVEDNFIDFEKSLCRCVSMAAFYWLGALRLICDKRSYFENWLSACLWQAVSFCSRNYFCIQTSRLFPESFQNNAIQDCSIIQSSH